MHKKSKKNKPRSCSVLVNLTRNFSLLINISQIMRAK
jgi:hypothetical protein